jgi:hypothetical protein
LDDVKYGCQALNAALAGEDLLMWDDDVGWRMVAFHRRQAAI